MTDNSFKIEKSMFSNKILFLLFISIIIIQISAVIIGWYLYTISSYTNLFFLDDKETGKEILFGGDFGIYYRDVNNFWNSRKCYGYGFFYLNYFYFIAIYMFIFPKIVAIVIHILITDLFLYLLIKKIDNEYEFYWFLGNLFFIIIFSYILNTDIWIILGLLLYQKHRDKWYSPFFLLISFFKIIPIFVFIALFLTNLIFERKIYWKSFPAIVIVVIIVIISFLTSDGLIESVTQFREFQREIGNIDIFIQIPHLIWYSYPIAIIFKHKGISIERVKKFWIYYLYFGICYCIFWLSLLSLVFWCLFF